MTPTIPHIIKDALAYIIDALMNIIGKDAFIHIGNCIAIYNICSNGNQFLVSVKDKL